MGYLFGNTQKVCFLSDISRMIPKTFEVIKAYGPIDVLIIDALHPTKSFPTHFNVIEAIKMAQQIGAKKTFTVGMSSSIDYDIINKELQQLRYIGTDQCPHLKNDILKNIGIDTPVDIELGYDGLSLSLNLE